MMGRALGKFGFLCRNNLDQGLCYFDGSLYLPRIGQVTKIDLINNNLATNFTGTGISNKTRVDGGPKEAVFLAAIYCISDAMGNIYVSDPTGAYGALSYVRKVDPDGNVSTFLSTVVIKTGALAFSIKGTLIIVSTGQRVDRRIDNDTVVSLGLFGNPNSVVTDSNGNLFISETVNDTIYWMDSSLKQNRILVGREAAFNNPRGLAIDSKGRLFVVDQANNAIKIVTWT
jgi:sugar lactone lactonase YvrE